MSPVALDDFTPAQLAALRALADSAIQTGKVAVGAVVRQEEGGEAGTLTTQMVGDGANATWLLFCAALVFIMQAGFAFLVAGCVRAKNATNIMLLHGLDPCMVGILYYLIGYGIAFGGNAEHHNGFIGVRNFAFSPISEFSDTFDPWNAFSTWLFQWGVATAAATILIGALAERVSVLAFFFYSTMLGGFVYPVVSHWIWSEWGWLNPLYEHPLFGSGMLDFAGSGAVHLCGGTAALWGAKILGPRLGRFDAEGKVQDIPNHSTILIALGTFILWMGWYGFNPGGTIEITGVNAIVASRTAVNSTLSAAMAGITVLLVMRLIQGYYNMPATFNGILAGLVGITGSCAFIDPWAAVLGGFTSGVVYVGWSHLWLKLKIDDPVDAGPLHGGTGLWGVIFTGLLAKKEYVVQVFPRISLQDAAAGAFYGGNKAGLLLAANVIGALVIFGWVTVLMAPLFFVLVNLGWMRIPTNEEMLGIDFAKHHGAAYVLDDTKYGLDSKHGESQLLDDFTNVDPKKGVDLFAANLELKVEPSRGAIDTAA